VFECSRFDNFLFECWTLFIWEGLSVSWGIYDQIIFKILKRASTFVSLRFTFLRVEVNCWEPFDLGFVEFVLSHVDLCNNDISVVDVVWELDPSWFKGFAMAAPWSVIHDEHVFFRVLGDVIVIFLVENGNGCHFVFLEFFIWECLLVSRWVLDQVFFEILQTASTVVRLWFTLLRIEIDCRESFDFRCFELVLCHIDLCNNDIRLENMIC
jgi:hypothetical protein